ncbi:uncharacterized protein [Centruroides vittatus]|uniref:uncharacterized protein n=1 Tax=Centruroides vittatus TaxID=120091 RepID=UPI00350FA8A2
MADYFLRYFEVAKMEKLLLSAINHMRLIFARHGIPEVVQSDNGTQFSQVVHSEYRKFADKYKFSSITSSPRYPQSNMFIKSMVKEAHHTPRSYIIETPRGTFRRNRIHLHSLAILQTVSQEHKPQIID